MLAPLETSELLLARLANQLSRPPCSDAEGLVSITLELPPGTTINVPTQGTDSFHFSSPGQHEGRIGCGTAERQEFSGECRLQHMQAAAQRLQEKWLALDPDETGMQPAALVAFAHYPDDPMNEEWQGIPNSLLWVPSVVLHEKDTLAVVVFSVSLPANRADILAEWKHLLDRLLSDHAQAPQTTSHLHRAQECPSARDWRTLVEAGLSAIHANSLQKVVVARHVQVRGERPFNRQRLHSALAYLFPDCQVMQIQLGKRLFAAATPERLISLHGKKLQLDAIAGTAARAASAEADMRLSNALQQSTKQQLEHHLVVQSICERLAPVTDSLEVPDTPRLLQLTNVQHLWTPLQGRIAPEQNLLSLAAALHPTPATSGYPVAAAQHWLAGREPFQRGWYTGAAGWLTPDLEGELWVLLRCALLEGDIAELYAGAGITTGSVPDDELRETEQKLDGMLAALKYA